ncbi:GGDEF domain-containing protein [Aquisalimonas lutea]|uniref:sensor domain-containing diguanylate cyclase n=1 Tax=Aquisalimonas lutea TaxID=1327750 RepID=UPI0025B46E27|nr:GGDEF domain-containing protein [Aquisalimonas lutea]MDN3516224.1 GGDEF domain-containing protein [Aquisalimonas lutea]
MTVPHHPDSGHPLSLLGEREGWKLIQDLWAHFPENMFVIGVLPGDTFVVEAINPAQHALLNRPLHDCLGRRLDELLPAPGCDEILANYRRCVAAGKPLRYEERGVYLDDVGAERRGHWLTLLVPIRDDQDTIRHLFGISQNVTDIYRARRAVEEQNVRLEQRVAARTRELEQLNRQLEEQASRDGLTHALNRRVLYRIGTEELERARRYDHELSVVMLDVDHFKSFNDDHGHHYGDAVLVDLVRTVQDALRDSDRLGRVGGDEFVILLPGTGLADARCTAERLRTLVRSNTHCSISLGVACRDTADTAIESVVLRADEALRQSKREGRDRSSAS